MNMSNPILEWMQENIGKSMGEGAPSPVGRWLNGTLRDAQEGALVADFVVRPEMTNPVGLLHGGMIATIMDDFIGATIIALGRDGFYTTIDLSVDYFASASEGEVVTAKTRLVKAGQRVIHGECDLFNAEGRLLARGRTNLLRVQVRE
ncbi:MAG: PaaI family thioesterase [Chloroflexota bacterium]|nr:MAG: PaaI family thioesterase [Chloroflexota bacterium]